MNDPFLDAIARRPLLCDGAMGTQLYERGASAEASFEKLNLTDREFVQQVHIDYINAGADVVETNSFSGNRFRLSAVGLEKDVWNINVWAGKIARYAREIAGHQTFVAGSVGPTGKLLTPFGNVTAAEMEAAFREQMEALLAGGVDLFVIETMSSLAELVIAVRAARKVAKLPVVAQLTFSADGQTLMGVVPEDVSRLIDELGDDLPDLIGINCGAGPGPLHEALVRMVATMKAAPACPEKIAFSIQPNAGLPSRFGGRYLYMSRPDYCASFIERFVAAGARLVGGCCGTTPEHIKQMRAALDCYLEGRKEESVPAFAEKPQSAGEAVVLEKTQVEEETLSKTAQRPGLEAPGLAARLGKDPAGPFFVSVELDPPKGSVPKKIIKAALKLKEAGADAINVGDSPMARVRMSSMATCLLIRQQVDIPTIIHFTTRDRNLMGIQADLLGCQSLGIENILALTGDPPSVGNYAHATAVYDVDSVGLIKIISRLNEGFDIADNSIGSPTALSIACALNPTNQDRRMEKERFRQKLEAGAHFVMTQPIYELSDLTAFLEDFGDVPVPILVGVMPLHSAKHAEYLHNEVPGITIPAHVRSAMQTAGEEGARVGLELAGKLIEELRCVVRGIYLVPSFGRYDDMCTLVSSIKDREAASVEA